MPKEKIIVMSVDRDNDIGQKLGVKGPVIGKDKILKVAVELSLKDPEDSDSNAMFATVKLLEEIKNKYDSEEMYIQHRLIYLDLFMSLLLLIVKSSNFLTLSSHLGLRLRLDLLRDR